MVEDGVCSLVNFWGFCSKSVKFIFCDFVSFFIDIYAVLFNFGFYKELGPLNEKWPFPYFALGTKFLYLYEDLYYPLI